MATPARQLARLEAAMLMQADSGRSVEQIAATLGCPPQSVRAVVEPVVHEYPSSRRRPWSRHYKPEPATVFTSLLGVIGNAKQLAELLGVQESIVSRWRSGGACPAKHLPLVAALAKARHEERCHAFAIVQPEIERILASAPLMTTGHHLAPHATVHAEVHHACDEEARDEEAGGEGEGQAAGEGLDDEDGLGSLEGHEGEGEHRGQDEARAAEAGHLDPRGAREARAREACDAGAEGEDGGDRAGGGAAPSRLARRPSAPRPAPSSTNASRTAGTHAALR